MKKNYNIIHQIICLFATEVAIKTVQEIKLKAAWLHTVHFVDCIPLHLLLFQRNLNREVASLSVEIVFMKQLWKVEKTCFWFYEEQAIFTVI